ncbi:MAG TPA: FecR domain-containing protein [Caulobacteraceae bacterium]
MIDHAAIEQRAAEWRHRQEQPEWSPADQAALEAWLDEATAHRVAFLRIDHGWDKVGRLASLRAPEGQGSPSTRHAPRWRPLAMAASLAVAIGLGSLVATDTFGRKAYVTEVGGHATVPLADGSKVELNTNTRLRAQLEETERAVWLDRGEAYFEVAKDASRPFVVYAGDKKVTVLGTKFSVRRDGDRLVVAVAEGRVRVGDVKEDKPPAVVTGGDVVIADPAATLVTPKSPQRVESELAWRKGLLMFDKSALGEAVDEVNRYNRKKLVVEDDAAAAIRITGSFEAENVEAFARLLRDAFGLNVVEEGDEIRISS